MTVITRRKAALRRSEGGQVSMYIINDSGSPSKVVATQPPAQQAIQPWPTLSSLSTLTASTLSVASQGVAAPRTPKPRSRGSWHPEMAPRRGQPLARSPERIGGHGINFWRNDDVSGVFTQGLIHGAFQEHRGPGSRHLSREEELAAIAARQAHLENRLRGLGSSRDREGNASGQYVSAGNNQWGDERMQEDASQEPSQLGPGDTIIIDHEGTELASPFVSPPSTQPFGAEDTIIIDHSQPTVREDALSPRRPGPAPLGLRPTEPAL
ncbi:hypothetical protein HWV62_42986 [Athelia sp. TMB]|nr:hypothetical protein HWV62_42986 [Athelia sp. TMB]